MKKLTALVLAALMLVLCTSAMADVVKLGDSGLTITIPSSYLEDPLTDEDIEDGMIAYYYNDDLDIAVYAYDAEGVPFSNIIDYFVDEFEPDQHGATVINGIEFYYMFYPYEEENVLCLDYFAVVNGVYFDIVFYFENVDVSAEASDIMYTVK